ncbi:TPA: PstS family phosphate ABC transporter substrate-binding protein [Salmonella enterica subsp. enterica serovar Enteritidis]|nr:PstS family phosphate ABC transporter substrate-binding protein [Salmonella enterica subsp. enterica]EKS4618643.1 PstS family phosphate ABC transporter substrate-binding protein [Salmonella enterica]HAE4698286.1 PstS family phosphate ABC transporter substrate-binding protein [Salmonella enterica subsp. enterica serovar Enteritidis]EHM3443904.1 PstS family phosphate ABC transporter substrate-binding protein [Salmonella enterica subsp. enterica]EHW9183258.1 PstS family phosphate ABC transporte
MQTAPLLMVLVMIAGCGSRDVDGNSLKEEVSWEKLVVTNTRGEPTLNFTDDEGAWLNIAGATALFPLYASAYHQLVPGRDFAVDPTRTPEAYDMLIRHRSDVIFVAQPSEGQKKRAADAGVKLIYTPFAREAFVFVVNINNPLNSLNEQQVRDIFSGKITNWREVGGNDERIQVWMRPEDSGSQTVMEAKVMKGTPMLPAKKDLIMDLMNGVISKVAAYQNVQPSIGYTFRYYATQMNKGVSKNIKLLAINGIAPTVENIRNGTYPYIVDAYMVTRENPSREAQKFVSWFLSPQGQSLVEDVGYVPLYKTIPLSNVRQPSK